MNNIIILQGAKTKHRCIDCFHRLTFEEYLFYEIRCEKCERKILDDYIKSVKDE